MRDKILKKRYLLPYETESELYDRVSKAIVTSDNWKNYSSLMLNGIFLPNSPTLRNAGTHRTGGFSACYVLPIYDTLESIYQTVHDAAMVHKYFGGTGFNFSELRATGSPVLSTGGEACGPLKVIRLLNESANCVSQGGIRQGANMAILSSDHPDVQEFIHAKDKGGLEHFNLSVGFSENSFRAIDERDLIGQIAESAWKQGCPGVIFTDRLERDNPTPKLGTINCTNPCGEQPLLPYESCNLGSINLAKFCSDDPDHPDFNLDAFADVTRLGVRFLDSVIDANRYPIPEIERATLLTRKIGLGIMGWHDCLIKMGYCYCSNDAMQLIDEIGYKFRTTANAASHELAEELDHYPAYETDMGEYGRRNATCTTIAPTGSISYLAGCSSGIEPVQAWVYSRTSEEGKQEIIHPLYKRYIEGHPELEKETALNISPQWHLQHQSRWQQYVDNAVSKTVNLPESTDARIIEDIFMQAYEMGNIKGVTIYRDKSKTEQVLHVSMPNQKIVRQGSTVEYASGCGSIHITTNQVGGQPYEVYVLTEGGCPANNEAIGKIISKYLHDPRLSGDETTTVQRLVRTLSKVKCITAMRNPSSEGKSCANIIATRMGNVWLTDNEVRVTAINTRPLCPECGTELEFGEGCGKGSCRGCGWSGCN